MLAAADQIRNEKPATHFVSDFIKRPIHLKEDNIPGQVVTLENFHQDDVMDLIQKLNARLN